MSDILKRLEDLGVTKGMPLIAKTAIDKTRNPLKALKESFPNAIIGENEYGEYFLNQKVWPIETIHGKVSLNQSCVPSALFDSILGGEGVRKEDTLAMDTETSGLSNGAGGFVFMIGMGYFSENNYFVDQLILPDLADEKAFLHQIEITFARFPVLLTYNGKGFDIPMIQSRINFHLFPDFTKDIRHIDLLMIARKYWKKNLGSVKLSNIEQFLLQLKRGEEEVPGFMAPELYREYLRTMDSRNLTGVAYHNQIDVISLSAFLIYLNNLCTEGLKDPSIWEKNNVFINNLLLHNLPVFASGEAGESTELLNAQPFSKKECLKLARKYSIEKHYQKAVKIYNDYANFDAECCYFAADILGNKMFDYNSAVSFLQHGLELIENNDAIAKWSKKAQIERFISVMTKFSEQARLSQKE